MRRGRGGWLISRARPMKWLKIWLEHAKIEEGPVFRRLSGRDQIGEALHSGSIAPDFQARCAVDRHAGEVRGRGEWPLDAGRRRAGISQSSTSTWQRSRRPGGWKSTTDAACNMRRRSMPARVGDGEGGGERRGGIPNKPILHLSKIRKSYFPPRVLNLGA